ncbi:MAG: hypothetical protein MJB14_07595 [Spirochaetes bacterium]|nr:hypothetical protein [Spirochaetota bacterium]
MAIENTIEILGKDDRIINNYFWKSENKASNLAIFFPGFRYPTEAPLFHFLKLHLIKNNFDVFAIEYRYNEIPNFLNLSANEQDDYLYKEIKIIKKVLETLSDYSKYCFISKSLGTTILYNMVKENLQIFKKKNSQCIWLTPFEKNKEIIELLAAEEINSIYIIGKDDRGYHPDLNNQISDKNYVKILEISNAGHLLEDQENVLQTIANNKQAVKFCIDNLIA